MDWVRAALSSSGMRDPELTTASADIDGVHDSAKTITQLFRTALSNEPSFDNCETLIIELQVEMEHLAVHWKSLMSLSGLEFLTDLGSGSES
jgi:hypothetical protein